VLVGFGLAVAVQFFSQIGVALVFAVVAATALFGPPLGKVVASYKALAASGVAAALSFSWVTARTGQGAYDPRVAVVAYEIVLLVVAFTFRFTIRMVHSSGARLVDQLLGDERLVGLDGLSVVLRNALADPGLRIYWWLGESGYVDGHGHQAPRHDSEVRLTYFGDASGPLAVVAHRPALLDDPPIAEAVSSALRLAVQNARLRDELDAQLADLEAARARLFAAGDRQRSIIAARLRVDVVAPLRRATSELNRWQSRSTRGRSGAEAIDIAAQEVTTATDEVMALIGGVPPALLGEGRLREALEMLTRRSPVPVRLTATPNGRGDAALEAALFYVCSEAMTNATKHSGASQIVVAIDGSDHCVTLSVTDDGCGGADPSGSGLQGLADRLASRGGQLRVESPPGAGTTVTATIPYWPALGQPILDNGSSTQFQPTK
jgi:signal transduction histidine kinase